MVKPTIYDIIQDKKIRTVTASAHTHGNKTTLDNTTASYTTAEQAKLAGIVNPLLFKGAISVAADFPLLADVVSGWTYRVLADVTDNDVTKTNTGQSFLADDEIAWNGANWTNLGSAVLPATWDRVSAPPLVVSLYPQAELSPYDYELTATPPGIDSSALVSCKVSHSPVAPIVLAAGTLSSNNIEIGVNGPPFSPYDGTHSAVLKVNGSVVAASNESFHLVFGGGSQVVNYTFTIPQTSVPSGAETLSVEMVFVLNSGTGTPFWNIGPSTGTGTSVVFSLASSSYLTPHVPGDEVNMLDEKITNLKDPTDAQDAATKSFVQGAAKRAVTKIVGFTSDCDYICDGTADDVQIQAALSYLDTLTPKGGVIVLREGTYDISATMNVACINTTMRGCGNSTILNFTDPAAVNPMLNSVFGFCQVSDLYIKSLLGTAGNGLLNLVDWTPNTVDGCIVSNVAFETDLYTSCVVLSGSGNIVTNCRFNMVGNNGGYGVAVYGNSPLVADRCVVSSNEFVFTGSVGAGNCQAMDSNGGVTRLLFSNNVIRGGQVGIGGVTDCTYSNNILIGTGTASRCQYGISTYNPTLQTNVIISGNSIYDYDKGIEVNICEDFVVAGNRVDNCGTFGIGIGDSASRTMVHGNDMRGCTVDLVDNGVDTRRRDNLDKNGAWLDIPTAADIVNVPTAPIVSTDVQAAINELGANSHAQNTDLYLGTSFGRTVWVDKNRVDVYTPTGNFSKPFTTIQAAIDYIASVAVSLQDWSIEILTGQYVENVVLENVNLYSITLGGIGLVGIVPASGNAIQSTANNGGLAKLHLRNIEITRPVVLTGANGSSSFADVWFKDCKFTTNASVTLNCINNFNMSGGYMETAVSLTNVSWFFADSQQMQGAITMVCDSALPAPSGGFNGTTMIQGCYCLGALTLTKGGTATGVFVAIGSRINSSSGTITNPVGWTFQLYGSHSRGNLTNNGTLQLRAATIGGTLTNTGTLTLDQPASQIKNVPAGTIAAVDVQAAINELDSEKQAVSAKDAVSGYAGLNANATPRITKGVDTTDDVIIDLATAGLVLKDTQAPAHYWRVTISNVGALTTTDLGTTKP